MHPDEHRRQSDHDPALGVGADLGFSGLGNCQEWWSSLAAWPPSLACVHQLRAERDGRSEPWFLVAEWPTPLRRCQACLPADIREALDHPDHDDGDPPIRDCDCCGRLADRAGLILTREGSGTVIGSVCSRCVAQRGELAGRAA